MKQSEAGNRVVEMEGGDDVMKHFQHDCLKEELEEHVIQIGNFETFYPGN